MRILRRIFQHTDSIVFKISAVIASILAVMILLLLYYNIYSYRIATENVEEQQRRVMSVRIQQIRAVFSSATATLNELALDNLGKVNAFQGSGDFKKYISSMDMADILTKKAAGNTDISCLYFAYKEENIYLFRYNSGVAWSQKFAIEDYFRRNTPLQNDAALGSWHIVQMAGSYYLLQNYSIGHADIGVLVALDKFLAQPGEMGENRSVYMLTDESGAVLATENKGDFPIGLAIENSNELVSNIYAEHAVFTESLPGYGLRLSCAIARKDIYRGVQTMQFILIFMGVPALFTVIASSRYLNRKIVRSVKKLMAATVQIESGNIDYQIPIDATEAREFAALIGSFNSMTEEIKDLKIQTYEETLERKNAELKYLQMQLRPHFYLNAITTISSLSMNGKNEQIQQFIAALSAYLRYLFTDNQHQATIASEVQHAVDFIKLQQIRHPNRIFYYHSVEPGVAEIPVQKLLFQSFVENIFKHAFDGESGISVFIRAQKIQKDDETFALITIEDTGCGFPASLLQGSPGEMESVGIANISKTLALTYGREGLLALSNNEQGGAQVDIYIPLPVPQ